MAKCGLDATAIPDALPLAICSSHNALNYVLKVVYVHFNVPFSTNSTGNASWSANARKIMVRYI